MLVYVAGAIRPINGKTIEENIQTGKDVAYACWKKGLAVICPHANTALNDRVYEDDYTEGISWIRGDLEMIARCDAVVVCPDSQASTGTQTEIRFAKERGIPVHYYPDIPDISLTEMTRPNQVKGYIDAIMHGYRVHLDKNADYSPANILGTGELGLMTRTWDKISRLMNLMGFHVEIKEFSYKAPLYPKCESIEDTIIDNGVYSIIWQLYRQGVWGN